jgi:predicted nuclease of restriction endonuclease-like (RecB) superfamily
VQQIVHDDYNFEFLGLAGDVHEGRIERALIAEIEHFMIELGAGFAFVGKFRPHYAGQINFYVNVVDDQLR